MIFFDLANYIGYFLIMIVFMVIAVVTPKSKSSWIWYAIGAIFQLLSLLGNQKTASIYGTDMTLYWIVYFVLLVITGILIGMRRDDEKCKSPKDAKGEAKPSETKCDMCDQTCEKVTYSKIVDDMGIRYRHLCDACIRIYKATPDENKETTAILETNRVESANSTTQIQFCRKCGNKLLEDSLFCNKCGTKVITDETKGE